MRAEPQAQTPPRADQAAQRCQHLQFSRTTLKSLGLLAPLPGSGSREETQVELAICSQNHPVGVKPGPCL